jgi:hypothetical protein
MCFFSVNSINFAKFLGNFLNFWYHKIGFHYKYAALLFSWTICLMYVYFSYSHLNCQEWGDSSFPKMVFIFFSPLDQNHTPIVLYCILTSCVKLTSCSSIQHDCGHVHNMYLNDFNLAFVNALFIHMLHLHVNIIMGIFQNTLPLKLHEMSSNLP